MDFLQVHGMWFIFFMFLFPRLTMLAMGIFMSWMNPLFFIGWLLVPRLTVAIIASMCYFRTNPVLCVITWIWALSGESTEKSTGFNALHFEE